MEPFIIDVAATEDSDFVLSSHEGEEFIMVMEGIMEISYGKNTYLLEEGDSIYYPPRACLRRTGSQNSCSNLYTHLVINDQWLVTSIVPITNLTLIIPVLIIYH